MTGIILSLCAIEILDVFLYWIYETEIDDVHWRDYHPLKGFRLMFSDEDIW